MLCALDKFMHMLSIHILALYCKSLKFLVEYELVHVVLDFMFLLSPPKILILTLNNIALSICFCA
jgi:hypothetical protein